MGAGPAMGLTMPYRLRYQLAWNHGLSRAVLRVYTRVLLDLYRRGARARGIDGGQTGMITALQRRGRVERESSFPTPWICSPPGRSAPYQSP